MNVSPPIVERAGMLARQGRLPEALLLLNQAAAQNDPAALMELGIWRLSGDLIPRDLTGAREFFRRASAVGHPDGGRVYNAFLANGTGASPHWAAALDLLRRRASSDVEASAQLTMISAMRLTSDGDPIAVPPSRMLSTSPHVELFPGAFTPAECRFLIATAEPLMQPALTVHPQTGQRLPNPIRTSDAAGFPLALENPAIHALNRRLAAISGTHVSHGEPLQVLRYGRGQQYRAHSDALSNADNQRSVTVLVYLNGGYTGGETLFLANKLAVKGEVGDALLFRNITPDGQPDQRSVHAGMPVTRGTKLIASRWIREKPLSLARSSP